MNQNASCILKRLEMAHSMALLLQGEDIQELLYVSTRSIRRFLTLFEETGDVSPAIQQYGPPRALDAFEEMSLIQSLLNKPEIY